MESRNLAPLLVALTWIEVAVVGAAAGLLPFPGLVAPFWPWQLTPFNAFFVGATYAAAWVPLVILARSGHWNPGRIGIPMIAIFTIVVLIATILGFDRLELSRPGTYVWIVLYVVLPVAGLVAVWRYRRWEPVNATDHEPFWRTLLSIQGTICGLYGVALFALPEIAAAWWPWPTDAFHGRIYSANYFTIAVASFLTARRASARERMLLASTQISLGLFTIVGFIITVSGRPIAPWGQPSTWVWLATFLLIGGIGVGLLMRARATGARGSDAG